MTRKFIIVIFAALLGLSALLFHSSAACSCTEFRPREDSFFPYWPNHMPFSKVRAAIDRATSRGDFNQADFEKLDFSLPGDSAYGDDARYEVFNPFGPFQSDRLPDWRQNDQSFTPETKSIFILRRFRGTSADILYGVITHLNKAACEKYNPDSAHLSYVFDFTPSDKGVVEDQRLSEEDLSFRQCISDAEGHYFYIEPVAQRVVPSIDAGHASVTPACVPQQAGESDKCKGWQPEPVVIKAPKQTALRRFVHPPPLPLSYRALHLLLKAVWIGLWVLAVVWLMSLLVAMVFFVLKKLVSSNPKLEKVVLSICLTAPCLWWLYKTHSYTGLKVIVPVAFLAICAGITYYLHMRGKKRLVLNEFATILVMILWILLGIISGSSCGGDFFPF